MVQSNQCIVAFSGLIDPSGSDAGETPGDVFKNVPLFFSSFLVDLWVFLRVKLNIERCA